MKQAGAGIRDSHDQHDTENQHASLPGDRDSFWSRTVGGAVAMIILKCVAVKSTTIRRDYYGSVKMRTDEKSALVVGLYGNGVAVRNIQPWESEETRIWP